MGRLVWCCVLVMAFLVSSCTSTVGGYWEPGDSDPETRRCRITADCPAGMICDKTVCRLYCNEEFPCPEGSYCDEAGQVCRAEDSDGDKADGDNPDGDKADGDASDGDAPDGDDSDGDDPDGDDPDGDEGLCADSDCPPRTTCDPLTGACIHDPEHCVVTGCQAPAYCNEQDGVCEIGPPPECPAEGCPEGTVCNERNGECEFDMSPWPTHCDPCFDPRTCSAGSLCLYDNENQEAFCATPCVSGTCPPGAQCVQGTQNSICRPEPFTCDNPRFIGGACERDSDCMPDHVCLTEYAGYQWPRGYCTVSCSWNPVDPSRTCASNPYARCTSVREPDSDPMDNPTHWTCLHLCNNSGLNCREDYRCVAIPGDPGGQSVCVPRN